MTTRHSGFNGSRPERLLNALERLLEVEATDLRSALTGAADAVAQVLGADKVDALLPVSAENLLVAVGTSETPLGRKQRELGLHRLPLDNGGRAVYVFRTGRAHLDGHVDRDPEELNGVKWDLGVRSTLAVPLEIEGRREGVLLVSATRPEAFAEDDLAFLQAVARWVGTLANRAELAHRAEQERVERMTAELERRHLEELFLQAPAAVAVLRGPDHVFTLTNPLFRQLVGRNRELDGRSVREALPEVAEQGYIALLDRVCTSGKPYVGREQRIRVDRDGNGRLTDAFFNFVCQPILGSTGVSGIFVHVVEVTELVHARQAVEALAAQREAILAQMTEGVITTDVEGRITFVNEAARRLHGLAALDVPVELYSATYNLLTLQGEPYPPEELPLARAVRRGETVVDALWRIRPPGGEEIVAQGSAAPVHAPDGKRLGSVLVIRDVTAQYELERQKDRFLASASHDLKNPLTTIKGVAQLLLRQSRTANAPDSARLHAGLSNIETAATRMATQIEEMLDVTRLRLGRPLVLDRKPTDLVRLAEDAVRAHQATTECHRLRIEAGPAELIGRWDPDRLNRMLDNLISNAIKFSPPDTDILVRVTSEENGNRWAVLEVQDQGLGIPAADLPRLFQPYQRGSNVPESIGGTGLGLAGARLVTEQHGGSLDVTSTEGQGSTFILRLPL